MQRKRVYIVLFFIVHTFLIIAQNKNNICNKYFEPSFIMNDKEHTFQLTFYENFYYRIAVCTENANDTLQFTVYDRQNNILFSNKDYHYTPYWNFRFRSTIECLIKVRLKEELPAKKIKFNLVSGYKTSSIQ